MTHLRLVRPEPPRPPSVFSTVLMWLVLAFVAVSIWVTVLGVWR